MHREEEKREKRSNMSGISNRLDDWPVQNTKRIRKKPQRFVAEEEEGKESKKKKTK